MHILYLDAFCLYLRRERVFIVSLAETLGKDEFALVDDHDTHTRNGCLVSG